MMMALGMFVFSISTAAYQELNRSTSWRHASNSRVGARSAYQFVGPGDDMIQLSGWIAPGQVGSPLAITLLRAMGDTGKAFALVDGGGVFHGAYVITDLSEKQDTFHLNGKPRRIEFGLSLTRIDESLVASLLGDLELPSLT